MALKEEVIEEYLRKQVKKMGGRAIKFTSSSLRSLPDRLLIFPGFICFVECKAPGRKPTQKQKLMLNWLRKCGHIAVIIDSRPRVDAFLTWVQKTKLTLYSIKSTPKRKGGK